MRNWVRVLGLVWATGRGGVVGIVFTTALDALMPAAQVVLLGVAVNAVLRAERPSERVLCPLLFCVVLFGVVGCRSLVFTALQGYWQASLEQRVSNTFNLKLAEKSAQLSLP